MTSSSNPLEFIHMLTETKHQFSDDTLVYFAYGSNMSVCRLKGRVSSAKPVGIGWLPKHKLMFRKRSQDGSGKCDIAPSDACRVFGVLFEIHSCQEKALDQYEGLCHGYLKKGCSVQVDEGRCMPAFVYYAAATHVDDKLKPYTWYLKHVIIGANEASLPRTYVDQVSSTESITDGDQAREKREQDLYQRGESSPWRQPEHLLEHPNLVNCERPQPGDERPGKGNLAS